MQQVNWKALGITAAAGIAVIGIIAFIEHKLAKKDEAPEEDEIELTPDMFGSDDDNYIPGYTESFKDLPGWEKLPEIDEEQPAVGLISIPTEADVDKIIPDRIKKMPLSEYMHMYVDGYSQENSMVILTKEEFKETVDPEHRHACAYFELDDILAGYDEHLDEIDPASDLYLTGVSDLVTHDKDVTYVYCEETGEGFEIDRNEGNYLEALEELGIDISRVVNTEEDDG